MEEVTSPVARLHGIHDMRLEDAADENGTRQYSALGHGVESTTRPGKRQGDQQLPADPLPRRRSLRLLNRKNNQSAEQEVAAVDDNVQEEKKEEEDFAVVISAGESQLDNGQRRSRRDLNRIHLRGTAPTFYRRLHTLFFSSNDKDTAYKSMSSKRIQLTRAFSIPPIYVMDDFLTASELEYFQSKIASIPFEKSFVDNMDLEKTEDRQDSTENHDGNNNDTSQLKDPKKIGHKRQRRTMVDTLHRTSTFFSFRKLHDSRISALESRVADFLGCWVHQIEAIQLVRYMPGQFFGVHHDLGDLLENDEVTLPPKHLAVKRRLVTIFCYLNTLETDQGGCTHFPKCNGLRVRPQMGRAVLWCNITADGLPDPRTIHAGEPVLAATTKTTSDRKRKTKQNADTSSNDTVKYGLNIWICEE